MPINYDLEAAHAISTLEDLLALLMKMSSLKTLRAALNIMMCTHSVPPRNAYLTKLAPLQKKYIPHI